MAGDTGKLELAGLCLAGGRSERMGEDKGSLIYGSADVPQVQVALACLQDVCGRAFVSISSGQLNEPAYAGLPAIVDSQPARGPAGALLSAFESEPDTAWLVLAVDMPRVSASVLRNLVRLRRPECIATVHRHADGTIEPLCAIWEPHARAAVRAELEQGRGSLRAVAQNSGAAIVQLPEPERLDNANTPAERAKMQRSIDDDRRSSANGSESS